MRAGVLGRNLRIYLRLGVFHVGRARKGSDIFFSVLEPKLVFTCVVGQMTILWEGHLPIASLTSTPKASFENFGAYFEWVSFEFRFENFGGGPDVLTSKRCNLME